MVIEEIDDAPLSAGDLLEEMVMAIVDYPDQVRIDQHDDVTDKGKRLRMIIHTDVRDRGRIIGKSGRTIESIRAFMCAVASKTRTYITVELADSRRKAVPYRVESEYVAESAGK